MFRCRRARVFREKISLLANRTRMEHKTTRRPTPSDDVLDLGDEYQVRQWIEIFEIPLDELTQAVRAYGQRITDVRRYVRAKKL